MNLSTLKIKNYTICSPKQDKAGEVREVREFSAIRAPWTMT